MPAGCTLTMAVNGVEAELHPQITSKDGEVRPAPSRHERTYRLARPEAVGSLEMGWKQ